MLLIKPIINLTTNLSTRFDLSQVRTAFFFMKWKWDHRGKRVRRGTGGGGTGWRFKRYKTINQSRYVPLTGPVLDNPDWSYVDGRGMGPMNMGQRKRYLENQELGRMAVKYMQQIQQMKTYE